MFCVITPVFDGCCKAASLLIHSLQHQSYTNFKHILISNGASPLIKDLVEQTNDSRVIYNEQPHEKTCFAINLIENLGKRRNYCIKNITADRYFFFDADLAITNQDFFNQIDTMHHKANVIVSKVEFAGTEFPITPIKQGNIDLANYCISKKVAEKYDYPTKYDDVNNVGFDWRFFNLIQHEGLYFSNILYAIKNGNNDYRTMTNIFIATRHRIK
jgi:glycosyltransferase involved in cell wall biosynthesis